MPVATVPIEVLLVEDNAADVRLTIEALKEARVANRLRVARDGAEAMALLHNASVLEPLPDLIFLDLNLPKKDGREVLEEIKRDEALRHIPVIVLTTSQAEQDIVRMYHLGANAFVCKPMHVDQFFQVVQSIDQFWFNVVKLLRP